MHSRIVFATLSAVVTLIKADAYIGYFPAEIRGQSWDLSDALPRVANVDACQKICDESEDCRYIQTYQHYEFNGFACGTFDNSSILDVNWGYYPPYYITPTFKRFAFDQAGKNCTQGRVIGAPGDTTCQTCDEGLYPDIKAQNCIPLEDAVDELWSDENEHLWAWVDLRIINLDVWRQYVITRSEGQWSKILQCHDPDETAKKWYIDANPDFTLQKIRCR